jgi:hypothetical protein
MERSTKSSKTSTTEGQPTGSGAGKASVAEPEEVMMIEETWMQPYLVQKEPDKILKTYFGTMICSQGKTHSSNTIVRYK